VTNVKIVSGDRLLASAARAAVLTWKYKPATLNDRPVASRATVQISFGDRKK
jgi:outer membrane biosynthesis protein TonB